MPQSKKAHAPLSPGPVLPEPVPCKLREATGDEARPALLESSPAPHDQRKASHRDTEAAKTTNKTLIN